MKITEIRSSLSSHKDGMSTSTNSASKQSLLDPLCEKAAGASSDIRSNRRKAECHPEGASHVFVLSSANTHIRADTFNTYPGSLFTEYLASVLRY